MSKKTKHYYGLKEIAEMATEEGLQVDFRYLSVYKGRSTFPFPTPAVMIGSKEGWTKEQAELIISELRKIKQRK